MASELYPCLTAFIGSRMASLITLPIPTWSSVPDTSNLLSNGTTCDPSGAIPPTLPAISLLIFPWVPVNPEDTKTTCWAFAGMFLPAECIPIPLDDLARWAFERTSLLYFWIIDSFGRFAILLRAFPNSERSFRTVLISSVITELSNAFLRLVW